MSQYRQIIVHAGLSKTGTTSIQDNCEKYRALLGERGIVYPQFRFGAEPFITHSIPVTVAITGRPGKYGLMLQQRFPTNADEVMRSCRQQLDHLLSTGQGDTLLLSTELIDSFDDHDMKALRTYLERHTERLRVVAYIRSPHSALESLLQERIKMGGLPDAALLVGRTRKKYENLQRNFAEALEIVDFHAAVRHTHGLVGAFFSLLGLPEADIAGLEFVSRNERLSMEAYRLMWAINERYPARDQGSHKIARRPRDLDVLGSLPGPPFHLTDFVSSGLQQACNEEAAWLESRLGFQFPQLPRAELEPLWQDHTLAVLEQTLRALPGTPMLQFAAGFLQDEARICAVSRPATARQLECIAGNILSGPLLT